MFRLPTPMRRMPRPIPDVNLLADEQLTRGQRAADAVARIIGSWPFIIGQSVLLAVWIALNVLAWVRHWDPYPFILLNLMLSLQAAYAAPIIMMSQNRQAARDRLEAHSDFLINQKAEEEIRAILDHLCAQDAAIAEVLERLRSAPPPPPAPHRPPDAAT